MKFIDRQLLVPKSASFRKQWKFDVVDPICEDDLIPWIRSNLDVEKFKKYVLGDYDNDIVQEKPENKRQPQPENKRQPQFDDFDTFFG